MVWNAVKSTNALLAGTRLTTIPSAPFTMGGCGHLAVEDPQEIVVDSRYVGYVNDNGKTPIPPTLGGFVGVFRDDLESSQGLNLSVTQNTEPRPESIFLTLDLAINFLGVAGRDSTEGYSLNIFNGLCRHCWRKPPENMVRHSFRSSSSNNEQQ